MPVQPDDYALVIGIDKYPAWNQGRRNLQGPVSDAQAFHEWLKDPANGGGLPEENIELVITHETPGQPRPTPIGQDISDALKKITMNMVIKDQGNPRRLYLFFSGHGHTVPDKPRDTNLCMAPFSEDRFGLSEALSLDDILAKVTKCIAPSELIVFLDCCRSIIVGAAGVDTTFACVRPEDAAKNVREALLFATLNFESAFEGGEVVRGHFSRALMDGLWGQAQQSGLVTLGSLERYLKMNVKGFSNNAQDVATNIPSDLMDVVLCHPRKNTNVTVHFSPGRSGEIVLENGNLEVVRQDDASTGPWAFTLDKGLYMIREAAGGTPLPFTVRVVEEAFDVTF